MGCNLIDGYVMARAYFLHFDIIVICKPHKFTTFGFEYVDKMDFVCVKLSHLNQTVEKLDAHGGK